MPLNSAPKMVKMVNLTSVHSTILSKGERISGPIKKKIRRDAASHTGTRLPLEERESERGGPWQAGAARRSTPREGRVRHALSRQAQNERRRQPDVSEEESEREA